LDPSNADARNFFVITESGGAIYLIRPMPYGTGVTYSFNVII